MLSFGPAQQRDVESLQNWLDGTGCLAREETAYLTHDRELVSLAPPCDSAVSQLEVWVEDKLIRFCSGFRKVRTRRRSLYQADRANRVASTISQPMQMCTYILVPGLDEPPKHYYCS